MIRHVLLALKRLALPLPGIVIAYLSARVVLPYIDRRFPLPIAILVTYGLIAYVIIPWCIRLWHYFARPRHLPMYCITPDGFASDPINICLIGSRRQLILAMEAAGWHTALPTTLRTIVLTIGALLFNKPFPGMPMSSLYLFGRRQDIGFEQQILEQGRGHRHHVRFWATAVDSVDDVKTQINSGTSRAHRSHTRGQLLWIGAASRDAGLAFIRQNMQLTHFVDSDTNSERDYTVRRLVETGQASQVATLRLHGGINLINRAFFARLFADGKVSILKIN